MAASLLIAALLLLLFSPSSTFTTAPSLQNSQALPKTTTSLASSSSSRDAWIPPSAPIDTEEALKLALQKSLEGAEFTKTLSILGSTGSIGTQTLDIVRATPQNFKVSSLAAGRNVDLLADQIAEFSPDSVSVGEEEDVVKVSMKTPQNQHTKP